jgi:hypothetical protein
MARGRGGDKLHAIGAAAAPLGTDEEAAGTPPQTQQIAKAYADEIDAASLTSARKDDDHGVAIYVAIVATIIAALAVAIWLSHGGASIF